MCWFVVYSKPQINLQVFIDKKAHFLLKPMVKHMKGWTLLKISLKMFLECHLYKEETSYFKRGDSKDNIHQVVWFRIKWEIGNNDSLFRFFL